jgi:hypothetical protein
MWSTVLGTLAALAVGVHLVSRYRKASRARREAPDRLFGSARAVLSGSYFEDTGSVGYPQLVGHYRGHPVQVRAVVDTLAVRKLPSLWLLVTIPEALPLKATFDLMMRPTGPTTFSNFERLPIALDRLPDFPDFSIVRTDDPNHLPPPHVIVPHLGMFASPRGKELLITPKGVRIVWQLAEAERGRYGIFRQAEFGDVRLEPELLSTILDRLIAIRQSIIAWSGAGQ